MKGRATVKYHEAGDIAVLSIFNPPVNVSSFTIRRGILTHLDYVKEKRLKGVVIVGEGKCFIAGSDINEFDKAIPPPELPDVIKAIEDLPCPVIAAIHGVALGGGLELALGCDYRIASADAKLGLPEVSLGMIPGAGGTQRLTALIGKAAAIRLVTEATAIDAPNALALGLIDKISRNDLLADALLYLTSSQADKRVTIKLPIPDSDPEDIDNAEKAALKKKGRVGENVTEAIRLIKSAGTRSPTELLTDERSVFQKLRNSDEATAHRYLFFSERLAASLESSERSRPKDITSVGIIGAGTMGQGIAKAFIANGFTCFVVEQNPKFLERAMAQITESLQRKVQRQRLTAQAAQKMLALLNGSTEYQSISSCELVIEAVFEDLTVKTEVLKNIEKHVSSETILASNTSYLDLNKMGQYLKFPDRFIGLHFFNPADLMRLLEIVQTDRASTQTIRSALTLAKKLKKQPVIAQVSDGFIGNRILAAYRHRAELLVLDGASPRLVDEAIKNLGFPMGPFEVADSSGLDIAWARRKINSATTRDNLWYAPIADALCESNRLGRKSNAGWYDYLENANKGSESDAVTTIIEQVRETETATPKPIDSRVIVNQLMISIVNAALCVVEDRITARPSDIDVVMTCGYGFPKWMGGPIYWATKQDKAFLEKELDHLKASTGPKYRIGDSSLIANIQLEH
jgi:3-hydroxyacyl-CoA dehydrogenase